MEDLTESLCVEDPERVSHDVYFMKMLAYVVSGNQSKIGELNPRPFNVCRMESCEIISSMKCSKV